MTLGLQQILMVLVFWRNALLDCKVVATDVSFAFCREFPGKKGYDSQFKPLIL